MSTSDAVALRVQGITRRYGSLVAVDDANLSVAQGQFLALLGPSGCGKTTLLRLIAGFEQPDAGLIMIGERTVVSPCGAGLPPEQRSVGMVFQDYALFPHLNVAQNVAYGLGRRSERHERVTALLELVGLAGAERRMPHQLSGGQQQRVALARALAPRPALLLLDEPFSNLDAGLRQSVRAEVRDILRREHVTAVFVTHDQEEALSLADQVAVMLHGRVAQTAHPRELYERPATRDVAAFVGAANFLPGVADGHGVQCALGDLPLARPLRGISEVLVRPEQISLEPQSDGPHLVAERNYFGADQVVELRLADGSCVRARLPAWHNFTPGDRVTARVRGSVVAFEA
ncbi:MAG: ABC transporter ATP-binding protein [Oscillochloridaceae bacterium umkhey_bin13]